MRNDIFQEKVNEQKYRMAQLEKKIDMLEEARDSQPDSRPLKNALKEATMEIRFLNDKLEKLSSKGCT